MKYLELAGWKINSCDDGPGIRTVLFLQGCSLKCPGCHNEKIQEREGGYLMDLNQVYTEIIKKCHNKRLTISGGEPLEQWDSLKELLICLKKDGFDLCVYTGWQYEQVPHELFELLNYLKVGNYIQSMRDENIHYVGSSNQKMYCRTKQGDWEIMNLIDNV